MKFLILISLLALVACGHSDSEGPQVSSFTAQQNTTLREKIDAVLDTNRDVNSQGKLSSFVQVKDSMRNLLACDAQDEIAYSRPTRVIFISDGYSKELLALDRVELRVEEEVNLQETTSVQRVFSNLYDDPKQTGKLALALLVLPENHLHEEKLDTLIDSGYWAHHDLALLAFQCVDKYGNPAQGKGAIKVSDRYLVFNAGDRLIELAKSSKGFVLNAQNNALVLKYRYAALQTQENVSLKTISTPGKERDSFTVSRDLTTITTNGDLSRLLRTQEDKLAQDKKILDSNLALSSQKKKVKQKAIAEMNSPDRRSILNRPAVWVDNFIVNHYNNEIFHANLKKDQKSELLRDEIYLLGDYRAPFVVDGWLFER